MTTAAVEADPVITSAEVIGRRIVRTGSRVKHIGQVYTGCATATVTGFCVTGSYRGKPWIKVLVEHDNPDTIYNFKSSPGWDWDRTEVAPDIS